MENTIHSQNSKETQKAGTGFMLNPADAIADLESKGYSANLKICFDHLEADNGETKIYPHEFEVDSFLRFENSSDPSDQSILYAISSPSHGVKGVFMESFGPVSEEISPDMLKYLQKHLH